MGVALDHRSRWSNPEATVRREDQNVRRADERVGRQLVAFVEIELDSRVDLSSRASIFVMSIRRIVAS